MIKLMLLLVLSYFPFTYLLAQKTNFDVASFTIPKGWQSQQGTATVQLSKQDTVNGTYCLITLYKAVPGTTDAKNNFQLAWTSLVKEMVRITDEPTMEPESNQNGWTTHSGYAAFEAEGSKGIALLLTASAALKMVNMVILTNTNIYEKEMSAFLSSVSLAKFPAIAPSKPVVTTSNAITGTWGITASDQGSVRVNNGVASTIFRQYRFDANGTYLFLVKTFDPLMDKILLGRETGTYHVSGNTLSLNPQKNVLEAWSKKNNTDWGKLLSSQQVATEKTTYQFAKEYIAEINEWQLHLQASQPTKRDGPFNNAARNGWIYIVPSDARPAIKLPGVQ